MIIMNCNRMPIHPMLVKRLFCDFVIEAYNVSSLAMLQFRDNFELNQLEDAIRCFYLKDGYIYIDDSDDASKILRIFEYGGEKVGAPYGLTIAKNNVQKRLGVFDND